MATQHHGRMSKTTRCGNPDCPTQPIIEPDDSGLPTERRSPCPECGSQARSVSVTINSPVAVASATAPDSVQITAEDSGTLTGHESVAYLAVTATIIANSEVTTAAPRLTLLGLDVSHEIVVKFADLQPEPDSPCIIEIQDSEGRLLAMGAGETPADALSVMFEQMLPPTSSEHRDMADQDTPLDDL